MTNTYPIDRATLDALAEFCRCQGCPEIFEVSHDPARCADVDCKDCWLTAITGDSQEVREMEAPEPITRRVRMPNVEDA